MRESESLSSMQISNHIYVEYNTKTKTKTIFYQLNYEYGNWTSFSVVNSLVW